MPDAAHSAAIQIGSCGRCEGRVELHGRLLIGEVVDCPSCKAILEVAQLEPVRLELLARIEEEPEELEGFENFELL